MTPNGTSPRPRAACRCPGARWFTRFESTESSKRSRRNDLGDTARPRGRHAHDEAHGLYGALTSVVFFGQLDAAAVDDGELFAVGGACVMEEDHADAGDLGVVGGAEDANGVVVVVLGGADHVAEVLVGIDDLDGVAFALGEACLADADGALTRGRFDVELDRAAVGH